MIMDILNACTNICFTKKELESIFYALCRARDSYNETRANAFVNCENAIENESKVSAKIALDTIKRCNSEIATLQKLIADIDEVIESF